MSKAMNAIVEDIHDPHPDIRVIRLRVTSTPVIWLAGQFMELSLPGLPARPYSIASAPHTGVLEFHIRNTNRGGVSQQVRNLKAGDTLTLRGPFGTATRSSADQGPMILIAGGMGLAPMKALIDDALHHGHPGPVTLYWGARTQKDLYLADYFTALAQANPVFTFVPVVEDKGDGLVGDAAIRNPAPLPGAAVYLSGPSPMVQATIPLLLAQGAQAGKIHTDDAAGRLLLGSP